VYWLPPEQALDALPLAGWSLEVQLLRELFE
jgi:hypothetical protein